MPFIHHASTHNTHPSSILQSSSANPPLASNQHLRPARQIPCRHPRVPQSNHHDAKTAQSKPTPVNLTNHSYFNLSAGKDSTILGHELTLNAGKYTPVNDKLIPTGKQDPVKGTPMDFTTGKKIGADIDKVKGGYDHNFIADGASGELRKVATVYDPTSGRVMEVLTTQPGIQFYTGNFLDGTLTNTRNGQKYVQHAALCLETQHFPDSPNQPSFPSAILKPGETFKETTVYRFSTK
jgi:aldose 1-epimerase